MNSNICMCLQMSSVRTVLVALIGFLPTPGEGALGALDYPDEEVGGTQHSQMETHSHGLNTKRFLYRDAFSPASL